jgi:serine/tyrosine/threonine adenylyltransferase
MLREYVFSEAMAGLLIPTSRSLAVVATNETVYREKPLAGAVLTRIASSHIRVGTFQYADTLQDRDALKSLADYAIHRHYRDEVEGELAKVTQASKYLLFFQEVSRRQARLIAEWLSVGFIHGVMNTDNMMISGETMDYGPCAFMNTYHPLTVFSSIDIHGRYAYGNQPHIAAWNLVRLAEALLQIIDEDKPKAIEAVNRVLSNFEQVFSTAYVNKMAVKLGLGEVQAGDGELINTLLHWMEQFQADFTESFIRLTLRDVESLPFKALPEFTSWYGKITARQRKTYGNAIEVEKAMKLANPAFVPRNQLVESALLQATEKASLVEFHNLLELIQDPFAYTKEQLAFAPPPLEFDKNYKTYCGT